MKQRLKTIFASLVALTFLSAGCQPQESESFHNLDKVKTPSGLPSIVREYEGFTVGFNPERHTPNYVAWELLADEATGASSRSNNFWNDDQLPGCAYTSDYTRSGFDRGHMCPAADQKWSDEAMHHSFVMANICPQDHALNTGAWKTLEDKERLWAQRDSLLVIVAGPIYSEEVPQTIGQSEVAVPSAFFKVMLAPLARPARAIGFIYPNMRCPGNMENYSCTVDEVERITGLDFFSSLPDEYEETIESHASFREWNRR